jgi:two-component system, CAI-1 autoinducer sensor kinase/phosphatase CqsS
LPTSHLVVFSFAIFSALVLSVSAANLRRLRLEESLTTMGILAHELRTPLATLSLLGDALRSEGVAPVGSEQSKRLEEIAARVYALSRTMNQQIDTQISNASLLRLPVGRERVDALAVIQTALAQYPFKGRRERDSVSLDFKHDFEFFGSESTFVQVINNLLKNALHAMASVQSEHASPALRIEMFVQGRWGVIWVQDNGVGIEPRLIRRVFEPFFSTQTGTGHGLGLAFCRTVVAAAGGSIGVTSKLGVGTTFEIKLPIIEVSVVPPTSL